MNRLKGTIICIALTFGIEAGAACVGEDMSAVGAEKNSMLSIALSNLEGFSYIRNQLDAWREEGSSLCATGIALEKNIYQYFRWFIQVEVRGPDGKMRALLPVLLQTASVQAHENTGPKPWVVMPNVPTQEILSKLQFVAQEKHNHFPLPADAGFRQAVQSASWAKLFDADSFSVTPLTQSGVYAMGWLSLVPGTGGDVFTAAYSPKVVLIRYLADGTVEIDNSHSGWSELLSPLDSLLNSIPRPKGSAQELEMVQRFSTL